MTREDLLRSKEYWLVQIQNDLYTLIEQYLKTQNLKRFQLAEKLGVTKGYITQILNGDYDHKISKMVDLALAVNKAPVINYIDLDDYIDKDNGADDITTFVELNKIEGAQLSYDALLNLSNTSGGELTTGINTNDFAWRKPQNPSVTDCTA
jgi:transcriptional regulator with XRE-family HTH domain